MQRNFVWAEAEFDTAGIIADYKLQGCTLRVTLHLIAFQVTMLEAEGAKKAIQDPNPVIDGRKANVNLAYLGAKPRGATTG